MKIAEALKMCTGKPSNLGTVWTTERKEKHKEIAKKQWADRRGENS